MKIMWRSCLLLLCLATAVAGAQERITSFASDITVHLDASMTVHETLQVISTGDTIIHGIVREFPTDYSNYAGTVYRVDFNVVSVTQDGHSVAYHIKDAYNGKRLFIGDRNTYVRPGFHTYTITYTTTRQLGFFANHDELFWNVTGNGSRLPIEYATAVVHLPSEVPLDAVQTAGYTGVQDFRGQDFTTSVEPDGIHFATTALLAPGEGFSVVVGWPKGFVQEPSAWTKFKWFMRDNGIVLWLMAWLLAMITFYVYHWLAICRMRAARTIIPLFYPPQGLSPSDVGFMQRFGFDNKLLAADIVDLAVRGFLKIEYGNNGYALTCLHDVHALDTTTVDLYDRSLLIALFAHNKHLILNSAPNQTINLAVATVKHHTQISCGHYLNFMERLHTAAVVMAGCALAPMLFFAQSSMWGWWFILFFIAGAIFGRLLKTYTSSGHTIKDHIDGFKLFLETTETHRMEMVGTPPTRTPELYEKYLPYAMALGVERQWTQQFAPVFERLKQEGHPYVPLWYIGRPFDSWYLANAFSNSLNSTIVSASTPPGRSSGFGSGGGSGRGGGGGGVGGW